MVATATHAPAPASLQAPRGVPGWLILMAVGFALWAGLFVRSTFLTAGAQEEGVSATAVIVAVVELITGLLIIQGACEALIQSVERFGARFHWDGFVAGTAGSLLATLPEFVVIALLVSVDPMVAFVVPLVTIFNNALAFSIYSFFLPKDRARGDCFVMPRAITKAGGELLIAAAGIAAVLGLAMLGLRGESHKTTFSGTDLIVVGAVLLVVFGYYNVSLIRNFAQSPEEEQPADPDTQGHPTGWGGIIALFALGIVGAVLGGEAVSGFADTAINAFMLPEIPTAIGLAFFAGISEYVIVFKAHRRGQLGIALSNVFGGITQVMFLLWPFSLIVIGLFGITGSALHVIPINFSSTMLILLLFPLFYVLLEYIEEDHTLSNLDAAAMTGIYVLLLYVLIFMSPAGTALSGVH
jgi:Ca2+/Na+ antiporter